MGTLIDVILPVFIVIGFGYAVAWSKYFSENAVDGLMRFAQNFAVPCLLFLAISRIDLAADFNIPLLASFYIGAFSGFVLGFLGARHLFKRTLQDSISIGFCALFSNTVLLGLPITERAYGADALSGSYAIISVHALITYGFGITMMEFARSDFGSKPWLVLGKVMRSMLTNPLLIGILLGFVVNIGHIQLPNAAISALETMATAALPAALFALGGVLVRYRPEGDMKAIAWVTGISLIVHPAITFGLGTWVFSLEQAHLRSAVLTAAMAPGVNTYLFANMYGAAKRVAASAVLIATALSIFSVWVWLAILP
ncbi:MAG: AEC family transporter [Paracoccaceae bacterium]